MQEKEVTQKKMPTLWIVGKALLGPDRWEFIGVFLSERRAVEACVEKEMFIGPAELNRPFPVERVDWVGAYYPFFGKNK
jgi:hypothetical protein